MVLLQGMTLGISIIFVAAFIGYGISLYNFFMPDSPIYHTGGAELVAVTTITIAILSFTVYFFRNRRWERLFLFILMLGLLLGTFFAALMLESSFLMLFMGIALIGWFVQVLSRGSR